MKKGPRIRRKYNRKLSRAPHMRKNKKQIRRLGSQKKKNLYRNKKRLKNSVRKSNKKGNLHKRASK